MTTATMRCIIAAVDVKDKGMLFHDNLTDCAVAHFNDVDALAGSIKLLPANGKARCLAYITVRIDIIDTR